MTWRAQIRRASYKGVPFGVTGDDKEAGRRTVTHEFPQREEVYVEDLGAAPLRFSLQAFVLGANYLAARNALERVLNEPGPGTLVHPWYGEITVSQTAPYKVKHSAQDGGMAVFTLSFARQGMPSPISGVNEQIRALDKLAEAGFAACAAFDAAFQVAGQTAYVAQEAVNSIKNAVTRVQAALKGDVNQIAGLLGAATGYDFTGWAGAGQKIWAIFQGLGNSALTAGQTQAQLAQDWLAVAGFAVPETTGLDPGLTQAVVAANNASVNAFTRHLAVVEAARAMCLSAPESRKQAQNLREGFMDNLDLLLGQEAGHAAPFGLPEPVLPDALYSGFIELRASTLVSLARAAKVAPEVRNFTPAAVLPALVLCHRYTGGIALVEDFTRRNQIIHPGFTPAQELEVLVYE